MKFNKERKFIQADKIIFKHLIKKGELLAVLLRFAHFSKYFINK